MPRPTSTDVYDGQDILETLATDYVSAGFVASDAFTNRDTDLPSGKFQTYLRKERLDPAVAQPINEYEEAKRIDFTYGEDTYETEQFGLFHPITRETEHNNRNSRAPRNLEQDTLQYLMTGAMKLREGRMATAMLGDNIWYNGTNAATAGKSLDLTDADTKVAEEFSKARLLIRQAVGEFPRNALMSVEVYEAIKNHDSIKALITGGNTPDAPALVTRQLVATALELENIYVMESTDGDNFRHRGKCLFYYRTDAVAGPNAGVMFNWTGLGQSGNGISVEIEQEPFKRARRMTVYVNDSFKVQTPQSGFLFNATTPSLT